MHIYVVISYFHRQPQVSFFGLAGIQNYPKKNSSQDSWIWVGDPRHRHTGNADDVKYLETLPRNLASDWNITR